MLAWTGGEEPNAALNGALARRGVEAMFGTLGNPARSWDGRFLREGRDQYARLAATGLALIASDARLKRCAISMPRTASRATEPDDVQRPLE